MANFFLKGLQGSQWAVRTLYSPFVKYLFPSFFSSSDLSASMYANTSCSLSIFVTYDNQINIFNTIIILFR